MFGVLLNLTAADDLEIITASNDSMITIICPPLAPERHEWLFSWFQIIRFRRNAARGYRPGLDDNLQVK